MKIARDDRAVKLGWSNWRGLQLNASEGYQSKLWVVHSKGGRCNFWGLLHCDDRRSPWWASRDGPQHDCGRSDTVMISMHFNSESSLAIFFIIPVLFCFWTRNFIYYTIVSCVWFLLPYVSLQSNWAWKPSKRGLSISFSLWGFFSLLTLWWRKSLCGSLVATCRVACSEISLSIKT